MAGTVENHVATEVGELPLVIHLPAEAKVTEEQLFLIAAQNETLRLERNAEGDLIVMSPAGNQSSRRNAEVVTQLRTWWKRNRNGEVFDSSAGFILSNGALRSPDAAWVRQEVWAAVPGEKKERFAELCPDFVVEVRSPSDRLSVLQEKMAEYIDCGARLGWLIDPVNSQQRRAYVYRPGAAVEELDAPESLPGDPLLPGFVLDLREIW